MDRRFDRSGRMDVAKPTFEEMARHWFDTFGTNPSVEPFSHSLSLGFELKVGGSENIRLILGVVLWPHSHFRVW
jgi:hypothetical protein